MIDELTWQLLEELYQKLPEIKCTNANDKQITEAENALEMHFSDLYRYFLKHHEVSSINDKIIYTLTKSKTSPSSSWSVVEVTKNFKNEASAKSLNFQGWYIVSENKNGEYIGVNKKGEVWTLQQSDNFEKDKIANDFEQFLAQLLS